MNTSSLLPAARVAALFASTLSAGRQPTPAEVDQAIQEAVRAHGGIRGCCAEMAAAYGDYPQSAVERTRWARLAVAAAYPPRSGRRGSAPRAARCLASPGYPWAA